MQLFETLYPLISFLIVTTCPFKHDGATINLDDMILEQASVTFDLSFKS